MWSRREPTLSTARYIINMFWNREGFRTEEELSQHSNLGSVFWSLGFNMVYVILYIVLLFSGNFVEPMVEYIKSTGINIVIPEVTNMPKVTFALFGLLILFIYIYAYVFRLIVVITQTMIIKKIYNIDISKMTIWKTNVVSTLFCYFAFIAAMSCLFIINPLLKFLDISGLESIGLMLLVSGVLIIPIVYRIIRNIYETEKGTSIMITLSWIGINVLSFISLSYLILFKLDAIMWTIHNIIK